MRRGFTLLEIIMVVVIVGILAMLALPQLMKTKERAFDKEATANLKLIQAAEKIYNMEHGFYYPYSGTADATGINPYLKLSLPIGTQKNWNYAADNTGRSVATRSVTGGRTWSLTVTGDNPSCSGSNCPPP